MKEERKEPIQIPHIQTINDHISYLTPTEHPLSANVVIIEGDAFFWVYDVGNHPAVSEILQKKSEQTGKEIRVQRYEKNVSFLQISAIFYYLCMKVTTNR